MRKLKGKKPLGRPRQRWEDDMKMDFKGMGWESIVWINLAHNKVLVNMVLKLQFPINAGRFWPKLKNS